jgi:Lon protease-like protein
MSHFVSTIRLFPLPNVVLFPRAILPLHIFEERYKQMVTDALAHDGRIAMALLKSCCMREYHDNSAIEPVVCIGQIISCERFPDGKYNLLLQGLSRAVIEKEIDGRPYRQAHVSPLRETPIAEIDLSCERWRLHELFLQANLGPMGKQYAELLGSGLKTAEVADLLAYNLLENTELKQSLLAEADVAVRVQRIVDSLQTMIPMIPGASDAASASAAMN